MNKVNLKEFLSGDGAQYFHVMHDTIYAPKPGVQVFMRTHHVLPGGNRIEGKVTRIDLQPNGTYYAVLVSKGVVDHVPLAEEVELLVTQVS